MATPSRRLRWRLAGILLLLSGAVLVGWGSMIGAARLDEIDELGISGYQLPGDVFLAGASAVALIGGGVLAWRSRD